MVDPNDIDTTGMTGISILFPNLENEWAKRTKGMSENNQWGELMKIIMTNKKMI